MSEVLNVEEIFGSKVFTLGKMRERLPKSSRSTSQKWVSKNSWPVSRQLRRNKLKPVSLACWFCPFINFP